MAWKIQDIYRFCSHWSAHWGFPSHIWCGFTLPGELGIQVDFDGVGVLKGKEVSKRSSHIGTEITWSWPTFFRHIEMINHKDRETIADWSIKRREFSPANNANFCSFLTFYYSWLFIEAYVKINSCIISCHFFCSSSLPCLGSPVWHDAKSRNKTEECSLFLSPL